MRSSRTSIATLVIAGLLISPLRLFVINGVDQAKRIGPPRGDRDSPGDCTIPHGCDGPRRDRDTQRAREH